MRVPFSQPPHSPRRGCPSLKRVHDPIERLVVADVYTQTDKATAGTQNMIRVY